MKPFYDKVFHKECKRLGGSHFEKQGSGPEYWKKKKEFLKRPPVQQDEPIKPGQKKNRGNSSNWNTGGGAKYRRCGESRRGEVKPSVTPIHSWPKESLRGARLFGCRGRI